MFGRNDDQPSQQNTNEIPESSIHGVLESGPGPAATQPGGPPIPPTPSLPSSTNDTNWQHPGAPLSDNQISHITSAGSESASVASLPTIQPSTTHSMKAHADDASLAHELIDIKQQALGQLSPLLSTLDQSPEEKFRTLMMMIQASDDQSMIKAAYEAAHSIQDEKARAQALLDIVNEINYFTNQKHQNPQA